MATGRSGPPRVLLVYPRFSEFSFWNNAIVCRIAGCKYTTTPLGLMTIAALLPKDWECRLVDMNTAELGDKDLDWADLVMTGGMITQQPRTLELVRRAKAVGKPVAVGGPDPTSQPQVYAEADFRVLDEAEVTLPAFIAAWEDGARSGTFRSGGVMPDVTKTPIPRFDLIDLNDYLYPGLQVSRGCPYTCEFCDIIELYGRVPRFKTPEQVVAELEALYEAGYRGHVDFVDDNFIGNKVAVKKLLPRIIDWSESRNWPFFFSTEATITLAADAELLSLMTRCDFRYVFIGIETPDPELLRGASKKQNTLAPIADSVRAINEAGIMVVAGFILGFDHEKPGAAEAIADCVEETRIGEAMVGLLTSLPNTQLNRRLIKEGRLLVRDGGAVVSPTELDQMTGGLNFVTLRPRSEILREYKVALTRIYEPSGYFARIRGFLAWLKPRSRHRPPARLYPGMLWSMAKLTLYYLPKPRHFIEYLRTLASGLARGSDHFSMAATMAALYVHLDRQTAHVVGHIDGQLREIERDGEVSFQRARRMELHPAPTARMR